MDAEWGGQSQGAEPRLPALEETLLLSEALLLAEALVLAEALAQVLAEPLATAREPSLLGLGRREPWLRSLVSAPWAETQVAGRAETF